MARQRPVLVDPAITPHRSRPEAFSLSQFHLTSARGSSCASGITFLYLQKTRNRLTVTVSVHPAIGVPATFKVTRMPWPLVLTFIQGHWGQMS